jgi:hypothetical protein
VKDPGSIVAAGYSGTPLAQKLGIGPGCRVLALGETDEYAALFAPLPPDVEWETTVGPAVDLAHVFATRRADLEKRLAGLRRKLRPDAPVWVSWPKKAARIATDITEDTIREIALPLGFVDIKVCAVSDIWSGLKLVVRKELRDGNPASARKRAGR